MIRLALIVAVAENGVIGSNNALPWRLPEDMRHFKRVTVGKPVIMGRKTFESIGKPLPGRTNIVITRNAAYPAGEIKVVSNLPEALVLAREIAASDGVEEMVVIGGAEIYRAALPLAERLYLTEVHAHVEGDAMLPDIDWNAWREVSRERHSAPAPEHYECSFVCYERVVEEWGKS